GWSKSGGGGGGLPSGDGFVDGHGGWLRPSGVGQLDRIGRKRKQSRQDEHCPAKSVGWAGGGAGVGGEQSASARLGRGAIGAVEQKLRGGDVAARRGVVGDFAGANGVEWGDKGAFELRPWGLS